MRNRSLTLRATLRRRVRKRTRERKRAHRESCWVGSAESDNMRISKQGRFTNAATVDQACFPAIASLIGHDKARDTGPSIGG